MTFDEAFAPADARSERVLRDHGANDEEIEAAQLELLRWRIEMLSELRDALQSTERDTGSLR